MTKAIFSVYKGPTPITVSERSKARNVFARSNTGMVGSNPTLCMDVCVCSASVLYSVSRGHANSLFPSLGMKHISVYKVSYSNAF
jgi:hypothetical protein